MGLLIKEMTRSLKEGRIDDYIEQDVAFHFLIAKASHNRFLVNLFVTIRGFMEQYMRESFHLLPWMLERSLKFHRNIYQAVKGGSRSKAVSQMKKHILDVQRAIQQYYRDQEQKAREKEEGSQEAWRLPERVPERLNHVTKIMRGGDI
jgi:DNA-binding FadR family transcriptional regulator